MYAKNQNMTTQATPSTPTNLDNNQTNTPAEQQQTVSKNQLKRERKQKQKQQEREQHQLNKQNKLNRQNNKKSKQQQQQQNVQNINNNNNSKVTVHVPKRGLKFNEPFQNEANFDMDENETDFNVLTPQEFLQLSPQQRQELLESRKTTYYSAIKQLKMRKVKEMSIGEYIPQKNMVLLLLARGKIIQTMGHRILKKNLEQELLQLEEKQEREEKAQEKQEKEEKAQKREKLEKEQENRSLTSFIRYPLYFELADLNRERFAQIVASHYYSNRALLLYPEEVLYLSDCNSFALFTARRQHSSQCQQLIDFVIEKPKPPPPPPPVVDKSKDGKDGASADGDKKQNEQEKEQKEQEQKQKREDDSGTLDNGKVESLNATMQMDVDDDDNDHDSVSDARATTSKVINDDNDDEDGMDQNEQNYSSEKNDNSGDNVNENGGGDDDENAKKQKVEEPPVYEHIKMRKGHLSPSLQSTFMLLTQGDNRILNTFIVYAYLKRLGFVVRRFEARESEPSRNKVDEMMMTMTMTLAAETANNSSDVAEQPVATMTDNETNEANVDLGSEKEATTDSSTETNNALEAVSSSSTVSDKVAATNVVRPVKKEVKTKTKGRGRGGHGIKGERSFDAVSYHSKLIEDIRSDNPNAQSRGWWAVAKPVSSGVDDINSDAAVRNEESENESAMRDVVTDDDNAPTSKNNNEGDVDARSTTTQNNEQEEQVHPTAAPPTPLVEYEETFDDDTWEILRLAMSNEQEEDFTSTNDFILGSQPFFSTKDEIDRPLIEKLQLKDGQLIHMKRLYEALDIIQSTKLGGGSDDENNDSESSSSPTFSNNKFIVFDVWRSSTYRAKPDTPDFNIILQRFSTSSVQLSELYELYEQFKPVPLYHAIVGDGGTVTFMKIVPVDLEFL